MLIKLPTSRKPGIPVRKRIHGYPFLHLAVLVVFILSSCAPARPKQPIQITLESGTPQPTLEVTVVPYPTRPFYQPGELVDYTAQTGDTLPALASHFNTDEKSIRAANPSIPADVTTLPVGFPMKMPIYYLPLWGNPTHIIPDSLFINGPAQNDFDIQDFIDSQPGWLKKHSEIAGGTYSRMGQAIQHVATNFSVSPRVLLALLEYQTKALSNPNLPENVDQYPLGYKNTKYKGVYQQLIWAANLLNNGYYSWKSGNLKKLEHTDGRLEYPDPWQNAGSVAFHYYFTQTFSQHAYDLAISENGIAAVYKKLFGDPWKEEVPHVPGSLQQPPVQFPFEPGKIWAYTGGPHAGWGSGEPYAAVDFAPPGIYSGCAPSTEWVTAVADGVVVRTGTGVFVLDLDGDGNERTGWVIFYLHLSQDGTPRVGSPVVKGQRIGHPSCEGGQSTGTHIHLARKYNGEWIPAGGALPFNIEDWIVKNGTEPYLGTLEKFTSVVRACTCSDKESHIQSGQRPQQ